MENIDRVEVLFYVSMGFCATVLIGVGVIIGYFIWGV